ncbi:MAG: tetratricopeptide repeat protein [Treponema sp.]|jgi:tetratricopeptide (TPR) repeat protein|nr:tetratricopeptide repeat protein [Treponema sp.]
MKKLMFALLFALCGAAAFAQNVLVLAPLQNDGKIAEGQIRSLTRLLENALQRTGKFDIIDRGATEDILREHGFQLSDLSDSRKTAEVSKVLNANYLVRPSVMPLAGDLFLESRIVDLNTAKILNSAEVRIKADLSDAYEKLGAFAAALTGTVGGGTARGGGSAQNAASHVERGKMFYARGDYDTALLEFTDALRLDKNDADACERRALIYTIKGDYDRAIADYSQAIRIDPDNASYYDSRGWVYYIKKDYDRAIADFSQAIRIDPNNDDAYYDHRGEAYREKKDYDRAIADFSQAIRIDPDYAYHYLDRGNIYREKKDYDRAIADYSQAIRIDPDDINCYIIRGNVYLEKKDYDRAITDYSQALRINPDNSAAKYWIEIARKRGR